MFNFYCYLKLLFKINTWPSKRSFEKIWILLTSLEGILEPTNVGPVWITTGVSWLASWRILWWNNFHWRPFVSKSQPPSLQVIFFFLIRLGTARAYATFLLVDKKTHQKVARLEDGQFFSLQAPRRAPRKRNLGRDIGLINSRHLCQPRK